jgi:hypothetical protein
MASTLDYASAKEANLNSIFNGTIAAMISMVSAAGIIWGSLVLTQRMVAYTNCGTGRAQNYNELMIDLPLGLLVPAGGWLMSMRARFGRRICRCAFAAALAGWATAVLCPMVYYHVVR